jgi:hypothetical protein
MGSIIDLKKKDDNYRCNNIKIIIVIISLIGPPISFIFLLLCIIRMIIAKKKKSFLTILVLLIFSSEMIQCSSKILQLFKYIYEDQREDKSFSNGDTPRGIICQIQIVTAIYSDLCSLLTTLLLSLRCYDVIKNKIKFFDKSINALLSIIMVILFSIFGAIGFLFIDRETSNNSVSYRFDVRDRCSYWCWLNHIPSLCCFGLYLIILILNIIYACKTNCLLRIEYENLLEENEITSGEENNMNIPLNEDQKENKGDKLNSISKTGGKKTFNLTKEEKKKIEKLDLMRIKCFIYPLVTIIIWSFTTIYRIADDSLMYEIDESIDPYKGEDREKEYFEDHFIIHFLVQFFFVLYTLLSSIRGILYGISFIIFEENVFNNFFRKFWEKCFKNKELETNEEDEEKEILRKTNTSSISSSNELNRRTEQKDDEQNIEMKGDKIE